MMAKEVICSSPRECKSKTWKLEGTTRIYICKPHYEPIVKKMIQGWCSYQKRDGEQSYHQKIKHLKKWARKGER